MVYDLEDPVFKHPGMELGKCCLRLGSIGGAKTVAWFGTFLSFDWDG